jgi:hypothetical protein
MFIGHVAIISGAGINGERFRLISLGINGSGKLIDGCFEAGTKFVMEQSPIRSGAPFKAFLNHVIFQLNKFPLGDFNLLFAGGGIGVNSQAGGNGIHGRVKKCRSFFVRPTHHFLKNSHIGSFYYLF